MPAAHQMPDLPRPNPSELSAARTESLRPGAGTESWPGTEPDSGQSAHATGGHQDQTPPAGIQTGPVASHTASHDQHPGTRAVAADGPQSSQTAARQIVVWSTDPGTVPRPGRSVAPTL